MDYRSYPELLARYNELSSLSVDPRETKESLVGKLMDVSREKNQIMTDANSIIREYIAKYEGSPEPPDSDTAAMLEEFLALLRPSRQDPIDPSISLRISRLLLRYYQSLGDTEKILYILQQCATFELLMMDHRDDYESSAYAVMAMHYLGDFDKLSEAARRAMIHCMVIAGYNRKDLTYGLKKFREYRDTLTDIRYKMGLDDFRTQYHYILFKNNALGFALYACLQMEDAARCGIAPVEPLIDMENEAPLMIEFRDDLEEALQSENASELIYDRPSTRAYIAQTDYHLGVITLDELLSLLEEYATPNDDYTPIERCYALLSGWPGYLDYLCRCGSYDYDTEQVKSRCVEVIEHVLTHAEEVVRKLPQYISTSAINRAVLQMICTSASFLEFDFFKRTVLNATVYANKELYVHTMMVKEICLIILDYILDHKPQYLDGVAGLSWEDCRGQKQAMLELMEDCALLHDIGKYYCLDIVNNSSRALTDDEFEIIKLHPTNFSKVYQSSTNPKIKCIRDCAELHHRWYNGEGGYPLKPHTVNKPFVNILTVADCIDAATDYIGRPYGKNKSLEQVTAEIERERDTRYCGYISELLRNEEVSRRIRRAIDERRQEIYFEIYMKAAEGEQH